jgi:hypothetical protein
VRPRRTKRLEKRSQKLALFTPLVQSQAAADATKAGNSFQISASKTKLMSLNASKFAFIYFHFLFRIEPFQWVAREKIKKSLLRAGSRSRLWANVSNSRGFSSSRPSIGERERDSDSKFAENSWLLWRWLLVRPSRLPPWRPARLDGCVAVIAIPRAFGPGRREGNADAGGLAMTRPPECAMLRASPAEPTPTPTV